MLILFIFVKATAGGGGRGMRLAKEPEEFVKLLQVSISHFNYPMNCMQKCLMLLIMLYHYPHYGCECFLILASFPL